MGGLFIALKSSSPSFDRQLEASREQFALSGFRDRSTFETDGLIVDHYPKFGSQKQKHSQIGFENGDFILGVGTFIYKGRLANDALKLFFDQPDHAAALQETHGHFVILVRKGGQLQMLRDPLGSYELFSTLEPQCLSTSFLAATSFVPERTIQAQEVFEYVFNGVSLGTATPISQIRRLDLAEQVRFGATLSIVRVKRPLCPDERDEDAQELIKRNLDVLGEYVSQLVGLFKDHINVALSGGYDSRLLLALFRKAGVTPNLFVYGADGTQDVMTAKRIASAEGISLKHVDKSRLLQVNLDQYEHVVRENFHREDALPWGGIFVNGAELVAREQRNAQGALHVNGGGGEIFRNFFYLPNRRFSAREIVWTFFSQYDKSQCTGLFDRRAYEHNIATKIADVLGTRDGDLPRRQVEALYPYLRCRSWFGRENSINSRWGWSVLPFFDHKTVDEALRIPLRYKNFGNFEAAMINCADPKLASHMSNYGYDFSSNAPLPALLWSISTYIRPPWIRRHTYRVKRRLHPGTRRPELLSTRFLERVLDTRFPYMSRFFRMDRPIHDEQFARICTLEYFFRAVDAR